MNSRVVVITGASSGIGFQMAQLLSNQGDIPVMMARSKDKMEELARSLEGEYGVYGVDVTSTEDVEKAYASIIERWGTIDVLINNAGFGIFKTVEQSTLQEIEQMMDVNYLGMVRCTKAVLPMMLKQNKGHIINVASMAGKMATAKSAGYSATKHAVVGFSSALRQETRKTGVYVTVVNPGPIATPFFDIADPNGDYLSHLPKWFVLQPEHVARNVVGLIGKNKLELHLPVYSGWAVKAAQLFPKTVDRYLSRMLNKK
ncbi:SDR family NAD(P)-dependent oxidoreductase [Marinicrinis lubricantis]|uniref:SDR family NAD(P)-dependent oxidoreductase n=1 Tax=Marinicrinis lubricantis TaxID=2086470 RepID=A0ABW1IUM6_9BACL